VAGAEVAGKLAEAGCEVVVFEQNPRPYGKIEDGLPCWHVALRNKEYAAIGARLTQPGVHFVPLTRIGDDVGFRELIDDWGFSGVVLANGAWRDRRLPVDGADEYVGKGLIYQNPFIIWFNHVGDPSYVGPTFEPADGAIVVGGGLASIDVAKVLMLETTRAALRERGVEVDMVELEVKGIPKTLAKHDLVFEDLGLEGCTIYYRRRQEDMPLVEIPDGATAEREQKVRGSRLKILDKATKKYRFRIEELCMPDELIVEGDRLVGLKFRRTRAEDGRVIATDETFEVRGSCVISSIGSIPLPIEGIPTKGELFAFTDWELGRLEGFPSVFSAGNIVTGKGNIIASRKHARMVTETMVESFLGVSDSDEDGLNAETERAADAAREGAAEKADQIAAAITAQPPISPETLSSIRERTAKRQREVGYTGDFEAWIKQSPAP